MDTIVASQFVGEGPPRPGEARKIAGGPLYGASNVLDLVGPAFPKVEFWTRRCYLDVINWGLEEGDVCELVRAAVASLDQFHASEWCLQETDGPWAACDAYLVYWEKLHVKIKPGMKFYCQICNRPYGRETAAGFLPPIKRKETMDMTGKIDKVFPDRPCSACGKGVLRPQVDKELVEHNGQTTYLDVYHSICDVCGIDLANGEQMNHSVWNMVAFCKKVDGLMPGAEISALRERLGLSLEEASQVFKGDPIPFHKYEEDRKTHSPETEKLLRQAAEHPEAFMQALDRLATATPPPLPGSLVQPARPASPASMPG